MAHHGHKKRFANRLPGPRLAGFQDNSLNQMPRRLLQPLNKTVDLGVELPAEAPAPSPPDTLQPVLSYEEAHARLEGMLGDGAVSHTVEPLPPEAS